MQLHIRSLSKDFLANLDDRIQAVAFFSFQTGKIKISFSENVKNKIGVLNIGWIRVYVQGNMYYDFLSSRITYFLTSNELIIIVSEDAVFIDANYIAKLINEMLIKEKEIKSHTSEAAIQKYYAHTRQQLKQAKVELEKFYSLAQQQEASRLNFEDTYNYRQTELETQYLLDLIVRQIINENKDEVLNLL